MYAKFKHMKLRGRMAERGITVAQLCKAIHISNQSLRDKLDGHADFKCVEVANVSRVLDIPISDIGIYFFKEE